MTVSGCPNWKIVQSIRLPRGTETKPGYCRKKSIPPENRKTGDNIWQHWRLDPNYFSLGAQNNLGRLPSNLGQLCHSQLG